jgi:threonine dehydratase
VRAVDLDGQADPSGRTRVWLALEMLQVTGSFKVRGALVSIDARRPLGAVVAVGDGNHGLAVAYAARVLGVAATLCVARPPAARRRARLEKYGAELVVVPESRGENVSAYARELALARGAALVSPDDLEVFQGNGGSLGFEIVRALGGVPERVLVPFGTGSLATGLAWTLAIQRQELEPDVHAQVWGALSETSRGMALRDELRDALPAGAPGGAVAGVVVPSEAHIRAAASHAQRDMGLIIERRAAAALAPVLFGLPDPLCGGDLVVVLTGRNVQPPQAESVLRSTEDGGL